ncbi:MAG: hypothetical protein JO305_10275 [Alphaproteobacteria bacterium]|nr:hypothetical protein [Alphaproteobacteria bacterium]
MTRQPADLKTAAATATAAAAFGRHGSPGAAVDRHAAPALPFTCGMDRGCGAADGIVHTAIYDEPYRS